MRVPPVFSAIPAAPVRCAARSRRCAAAVARSAGCVAVLVAGCVAQEPGSPAPAQAAAEQRYELSEVRERLDRLEVGMSKRRVLLALGSPAVRGSQAWEYHPERAGLVLPAEAVRVLFEGDRYAGYEIVPIVLGEELD